MSERRAFSFQFARVCVCVCRACVKFNGIVHCSSILRVKIEMAAAWAPAAIPVATVSSTICVYCYFCVCCSAVTVYFVTFLVCVRAYVLPMEWDLYVHILHVACLCQMLVYRRRYSYLWWYSSYALSVYGKYLRISLNAGIHLRIASKASNLTLHMIHDNINLTRNTHY